MPDESDACVGCYPSDVCRAVGRLRLKSFNSPLSQGVKDFVEGADGAMCRDDRNTSTRRFPVIRQFPAYSAESSVKTPLTARKYREQVAYEVVVIGDFRILIGGNTPTALRIDGARCRFPSI
jgi:hypothetical protein